MSIVVDIYCATCGHELHGEWHERNGVVFAVLPCDNCLGMAHSEGRAEKEAENEPGPNHFKPMET